MIHCKICGFEGEPIREYRATEKLLSCPKCGILIHRTSFPLAHLPAQGVRV